MEEANKPPWSGPRERFRSDAHTSDENAAASAKNLLCWGDAQISASSGSSGTEGQLWEHRDCHQNSREALSPHGLCKSGRPFRVTAWEGKEWADWFQEETAASDPSLSFYDLR